MFVYFYFTMAEYESVSVMESSDEEEEQLFVPHKKVSKVQETIYDEDCREFVDDIVTRDLKIRWRRMSATAVMTEGDREEVAVARRKFLREENNRSVVVVVVEENNRNVVVVVVVVEVKQ